MLALHELDPGHGPMKVRETPLAQAIDALGSAAAAMVGLLGLARESAWSIITMICGDNLIDLIPDG